jgi:hypothetical protein
MLKFIAATWPSISKRTLKPYVILPIAAFIAIISIVSNYLPGLDHLPLIWAFQIELQGGSAYGPEMHSLFKRFFDEPYASGGFAYPLTALWLSAPVAIFPAVLHKMLSCLLGAGSVVIGMRLLKMPLELFLFLPVLLSIYFVQVSLLIVGLCLIGIWAMRQEHWHLTAWLSVLLGIAKPQASLVIACVLAFQVVRAGQWKMLLLPSAILIGTPFLLEPSWFTSWLTTLSTYRGAIPSVWHFYWIVLAGILFWQRQFWPGIAVLQIALFPLITSPYVFCPLLIANIDLRSKLNVWMVVAFSWTINLLWGTTAYWLCVLIAFALPLFYIAWQTNRKKQTEQALNPELQSIQSTVK